jgi:hypothetical protein
LCDGSLLAAAGAVATGGAVDAPPPPPDLGGGDADPYAAQGEGGGENEGAGSSNAIDFWDVDIFMQQIILNNVLYPKQINVQAETLPNLNADQYAGMVIR